MDFVEQPIPLPFVGRAVWVVYIRSLLFRTLSCFMKELCILQKNLTDKSYCAYWDYEANDGYGNWSTDGCYSNGTINGRIICLCNHLTNFAILTVSVQLKKIDCLK